MTRCLAWVLLFSLTFLLGCQGRTTSSTSSVLSNVPSEKTDPAPGPLVCILMPPAKGSRVFADALRSELSAEFQVMVYQVGPEASPSSIAKVMQTSAPEVVVLVDNGVSGLYGRWARQQSNPPPSVIVMTSFLGPVQASIPNSTGISFELPAVTTLTDARRILRRPLRRVGVIYRDGFDGYLAREKARLRVEQLELLGHRVPRRPSAGDVGRALIALRRAGVDAIWVTNDNRLLTERLLARVWLPFVQSSELPFVVGVASLVTEKSHFGIYAAVPDIEGIGMQAADLIYTLRDRGYDAERLPVQPPLSVRSFVDTELARRLGAVDGYELTVDVLVGESQARGRGRVD